MSRLAHLGLGNFFRAHQAWYTERANALPGAEPWTYTAFTGRSAALAAAMTAGGDRYTLVERGADGDTASTVAAVAASRAGDDADAWIAELTAPELAVVTLTVTETGYSPDTSPVPRRLVDGLAARRAARGGPLALLSCDNLSGNGGVLRTAVLSLARASDPGLAGWIDENVSFPSTMVDRITPASDDPLVVITEPFSEWVIAGEFPAGRPAWDAVGARFVADVAPFERRKLWLLNAGHSLLSYLGLLRGFETVDRAFADPGLRAELEELWAEARPVLGAEFSGETGDAETDAALDALRTRFANPRIAHRLDQIARNGREKLEQRQRAIMRARVEAGLSPGAACQATIDAFDEIVRRGRIRVD